jgi:PAS domain S-box-containing protein
MVTGKSESADIVEAFRLGANDYVTKPIDFAVTLARVQTLLSRKRSEEALRESEERYALAVRGANDGLWDWNLKDGQLYFSPRWKAMLGCENGEIGNRLEDWFVRVHPDDRVRLKGAIEAHLKGKTAHYESEHRMLHQDGTYRWMLSRGLAVRDEQGNPTRMAGSQTDITEGKVADALTGLPNRLLFMDRLEQVIKRAKRRKGYQFALFFMDVDRFKIINDSLGHVLGDQLLVGIARRVESCLRLTDSIARYDEKHTVARLGGEPEAVAS